MITAIFIGALLGAYSAYMVGFFYKNKASKYVAYIRFFVVVSVSVLGPFAIYILRAIEGVDAPLRVSIAFSISIIICFLLLFNKMQKK